VNKADQITGEPKGLACPNSEEGSPPLMRLAYQFQGQRVKDQGHEAHNADTHRAPDLPNGKACEIQTC